MIYGHGFGMSCAVGMATARARYAASDSKATSKLAATRCASASTRGPNPMIGRTVSVRGTDDAARRMARQTLNRLVVEADKGRRPSSVVSLGHVIDEWLRVAEHEDSTREAYIERTIKPAPGSMSIAKLHHARGPCRPHQPEPSRSMRRPERRGTQAHG